MGKRKLRFVMRKTVTVGLEPVDSGGTKSAVVIIAAAKRGLYVTNEIHSPVYYPCITPISMVACEVVCRADMVCLVFHYYSAASIIWSPSRRCNHL